jgi:rhomboid protease GluP
VIGQQDYEFVQAFYTRRAVVAYSLFALNIIIFALMTLAGGSENPATLSAFGAKENYLIDDGQIWRFITPIFLHIGLLHLVFNSYALWIVGPQVEKLYGGPRFLVLYLLTGVAGVAASYGYHPDVPSAGASGAIFGLFGVLLVFSFKYRKTVPAFFSQALGKGMLMTVAINLAIGYFIPQIDLSAHVGGFIAGGLLAIVVPFARPGEPEHPFFKVLQAAVVALVAVSFFQVATHYAGPSFSVQRALRGDTTGAFINAMNIAQNAFENSEIELQSGDPKNLPLAARGLTRAIDVMNDIPAVSDEADQFSSQFLDVLQKQFSYIKELQRSGRSDFDRESPQSARYRRLRSSFMKWVDEEGAKYGIQNSR